MVREQRHPHGGNRRVVRVQLVSLEESPLHGALKSIPRKPFELDPEYEVDPSQLVIMEKIGERVLDALTLFLTLTLP